MKKIIANPTYLDHKPTTIRQNLIFAMVDGIVCNAITGTSSTQKCYICSATSTEHNFIDKL